MTPAETRRLLLGDDVVDAARETGRELGRPDQQLLDALAVLIVGPHLAAPLAATPSDAA